MDLHFSPAEEAFRREVREILHSELPSDWEGGDYEADDQEDQWQIGIQFLKKMAKRGWIAPHWPKEWGGMQASIMEQVIYSEEMAYRRAPSLQGGEISYLGPTIIIYGSDEQKRRYIPPMAQVEEFWCQGFSEPNAGSDLASLQTRAVRDGDDYILSGTKIWTTNAHHADYCLLLARTDTEAPKHRGISYFIVDMHAPGVTVQPLINMAGLKGFNQCFFDNVRIPAKNLLGEENRGWYQAMTTLDFERSNISSAARAQRNLEELVECLKQPLPGGGTAWQSPAVRYAIADRQIEIAVGRMISYRVATMQNRGLVPNYESSMAKVYHTELAQRIANSGLAALGLYGQLSAGSPQARLKGRIERDYLHNVSLTIESGSSEIQRNVIATRGLGLPRS
ncbi:MAG: acyl-CoA dehydrogenase family protein [Dehalococcoidia bacterium]